MTYPPTERLFVKFEMAEAVINLIQPFADGPLVAVNPHGSFAVVLDRTVIQSGQLGYSLRQWTPLQGWGVERRISVRPKRISRSDVDSALAGMQGGASRIGPGADIPLDSLRSHLYRPMYHPPVAEARIASDSSIWIRTVEEGPGVSGVATWTVLNAQLEIIRKVDVPAGASVLDAEKDYLWAVQKDSLDIPAVVRFRLIRSKVGPAASLQPR